MCCDRAHDFFREDFPPSARPSDWLQAWKPHCVHRKQNHGARVVLVNEAIVLQLPAVIHAMTEPINPLKKLIRHPRRNRRQNTLLLLA